MRGTAESPPFAALALDAVPPSKRSPLPAFHIAAHAAVTDRTLLTRDRPRHLELLPQLRVIAPE